MADDRWTAETEELGTAALWKHGNLGEVLDADIERDLPEAVAFTWVAVNET